MAGRRRTLIIVLAGVAVLAAIFLVTKVVMPHTAPSNPIAPLTSAVGKARGVANASNAAGAKLNAAGGTAPTSNATTATTAPAVPATTLSGPPPNTTRNPFIP